MATDYVLFIHGVNVRETDANERMKRYVYADKLFDAIADTVKRKDPSRQLKKVPLYWGDANRKSLQELTGYLQQSSVWDKLWFREFREEQLLQFTGDAALYISRHVGSLAVSQLKQQALDGLKGYQSGDRLHLVTHSWGTVILFDVLFANRWTESAVPDIGRNSVTAIRQQIFGLLPEQEAGLRLASIHTMGSPIALFSLITISGQNNQGGSSHDLSNGFETLMSHLNSRLPWRNFIHPGDPVAWPLEKVISRLVDPNRQGINIQDVLTQGSGFLDFLSRPAKNSFLSLANGGSAHNSYWENKQVAQQIGEVILQNP